MWAVRDQYGKGRSRTTRLSRDYKYADKPVVMRAAIILLPTSGGLQHSRDSPSVGSRHTEGILGTSAHVVCGVSAVANICIRTVTLSHVTALASAPDTLKESSGPQLMSSVE
ncbi:hypothetical protein J6590_041359 [Homalodisca vitripennis]|nr:hypothetical protein J6590_041359 [Homalodisca vitripennis]